MPMKTTVKLFLAAILLLPSAWPQVAKDANKNYQTAEGRAKVAKTLEDPHRTDDIKAKELFSSFAIKPGSTVVDVGTGVGAFLPFLSEAVGPSGRVVAEDIAQDFLDKAQSRAKSSNLSNVTFVLGGEHDPKLPQNQVDLVWIYDVYHHFDYPAEMLGHISRALKPDGRLVIGDMYRNKGGRDMRDHVRIDRDEVIKEIEENGFKLGSYEDRGTNQYVLIFSKK
jgi:ubiquinone/menaquinone biosynthesis C-methylase UbiE